MHLDDSDKMTPLKFREKLATDIARKYATPTTSSRHGRGGRENNELCLIRRHFPAYVENTDNSNLKKQKNIRQCVVCHKYGIRKETCFICRQCDHGLCAVPCFENFHSLKNITYLLHDLSYKLFIYFLFYLRVKVAIYHQKFILCAYIV